MSPEKSGKYKIGFVAENALGGVISVLTGLIELLDSDQFECHIALINYSWRNVTPASDVFKAMDLDPHIIDISHSKNKYRVLDGFQREFIGKMDLIVSGDQYEMIAYCIGMLRIPHVMIVHTDGDYETRIVHEFSGIIDYYAPISEQVGENVKAAIGHDQAYKIRKCSHALPVYDLPIMDPQSDRFTIAFVGRFNKIKGVEHIIHIGELLRERSCDFDFIFITNGIDQNWFKERWVYDDNSVYHVNIPNQEVQSILSKANVILMPSLSEGFPVALVEAMRRGLVPVCSDLRTAFPELIDNGINGYMINVDQPQKFRDVLMNLNDDRHLLANMSRLCLQRVEEKFNPYKNALAYQNVFLEAIKKQNGRSYPDFKHRLGRLDRPYVPDFLFGLLRSIIN